MTEPRTRRIGDDQVVARDDHLLVISSVEMEDWEVRQHRHTLIRFVDRTWRVAGKTTAEGKTHYKLVPWTPGDPHLVGRSIDYNAEYVALRDQAAPKNRARNRATGFLRWVSPLIGFLPARTKARLELTHGIDPVATTFQSVILEVLVTLGSFVLAAIGIMSRGMGGAMQMDVRGVTVGLSSTVLVVIGVVAGIDAAIRYDRILGEERPPPGFYEWLVTRRPSLRR